MRTIVTCILRLLVEKSEPRTLRGSVQPVGESQSRPFTDGQELLDLLRQLAEQVPEGQDAEPGVHTSRR